MRAGAAAEAGAVAERRRWNSRAAEDHDRGVSRRWSDPCQVRLRGGCECEYLACDSVERRSGGTATIALILHDPDVAIGGDDVLHWAIFNIPATATGLPEGVPAKAMLDDGSVQINNIGGSIGYFNPCPPPPTTHHYMFEFYALDTKLDPAPASRADLLKAMNGHIRAKGVYFGLFHQ